MFEVIITTLQSLEPMWVEALLLLVAMGAIVGLYRVFGPAGLFVYITVALIGANLQVLKVVQFDVFISPVPIGTVVFCTVYLCTDILAEHHGRRVAQQAVWLGFSAMLLWTVIAVLTLGYAPLTPEQAGEGYVFALGTHDHMAALFTPLPVFLIAGMTAYLVSQSHDVWLYGVLNRLFAGKHLWLRNNCSTAISGLIDNAVFSVIAFSLLADQPVSAGELILTYILGTYVVRLVVAMLDTPFLYLIRWLNGQERSAPPLALETA